MTVIERYVERIEDLEALVKWLSLPYGDSEPVFAGADGNGTWDTDENGNLVRGKPYPNAERLRELYRSVTGRTVEVALTFDRDGLPIDPRHWVQCKECGKFSCVSDMVTT